LKLKITVDRIQPNDRYLELGFIQKHKIPETLIGSYLIGDLAYCGYKAKGMKGKIPSLPLGSKKGLEEGD